MSKISFEIIGHIMILRGSIDEKALIKYGKQQLQNRNYIRTIAVQTSKVEGQERTRKIRYLVGEDNFETIHKEYGNEYLLNPSLVFFSPRLSYERNRIANLVKDDEVIINFFSGVGPFSIAIARKCSNCFIHSIEINENAHQYLLMNIERNKCNDRIKPYLGDAFQIVQEQLLRTANRILLPLPLEADKSLFLAIKALKKNKGTIHWQITEKIYSKSIDLNRIEKRIKNIFYVTEDEPTFNITEKRLIRWLSARIAHIAVDLEIT